MSHDRKGVPLPPFHHAVCLFPIAYTLHVLEELPHFTSWAQQYANAGFTMRDYVTIHLTGIVVALMAPLLVRHFPKSNRCFLLFHVRVYACGFLQHHISRGSDRSLWRLFSRPSDRDDNLSNHVLCH